VQVDGGGLARRILHAVPKPVSRTKARAKAPVLEKQRKKPNAPPPRLAWAVDMLALKPADQVLEIGCGPGVAARLVCERLPRGKLIGIDRSATAIKAARAANQAHLRAGRAEFRTTSLSRAALDGERFHTIFAFNVGALRKPGATDLATLAAHLRPKGQLLVFEQPPSAAMTAGVAEGWLEALKENGFAVRDIVLKELSPAPVVCVIASRA
jgi:trans-aconitate methyltransferase